MSVLLASAGESSGGSFAVVPDAGLIAWTLLAVGMWLGFAVLIGRAGRARGHGFWLLFLASLVLSPVLALLALVVLPRRAGTA